jgi:hypothetical protein
MTAAMCALGLGAVLGVCGYGACLAGVYRLAGALIAAMWIIACVTGAVVMAGVV